MTTQKDLWYGTRGSRSADIVLVGEGWGKEEKRHSKAFVGGSGRELDTMLKECGFAPEQCFFTNLYTDMPRAGTIESMFDPAAPKLWGLHPMPELKWGIELVRQQIKAIKPKIVIALGSAALWALTENAQFKKLPVKEGGHFVPGGIMNWRGSMLRSRVEFGSIPVLPILHPAFILRAWEWRQVTKHDLRTRIPQALANKWDGPLKEKIATPEHGLACGWLRHWLDLCDNHSGVTLACDIETKRRNITCIGFAPSSEMALCIPLVGLDNVRRLTSYWTVDQELELFHLIRRLIRHPKVRLIGQNFKYDMTYLSHWYAAPDIKCFHDTMLAQHAMFPGTPKPLEMLASLYMEYYVFWKNESQEWHDKGEPEQLYYYNCQDCLSTFEIYEEQLAVLDVTLKWPQFNYLMDLNQTCFNMEQRGIRVDFNTRRDMIINPKTGMSAQAVAREQWLLSLIPQSTIPTKSKVNWPQSDHQQKSLFYDQLGLKPRKDRKTGSVSLNAEAIEELMRIYPEYTRIFETLLELRSIGVLHSNALSAQTEPNGRMQCTFSPGGTETYRLSSSKNPFGRGTNMQNITKGDKG